MNTLKQSYFRNLAFQQDEILPNLFHYRLHKNESSLLIDRMTD